MKLQATVTSAFFPAALGAASISLALLLLPAGAAPTRSSGVAPALKLVAGDVVAAVGAPVRAVTRADRHPKPVALSNPEQTTAIAPTPTESHAPSVRKSNAPVRHRRATRRVTRPRPVARAPLTTHSTQHAPASPVPEHGHGKAKAWGHSKQLEPKPLPAVTRAVRNAGVGRGHGKALGHPADVPHGPPTVPPGQAKHEAGGGEHAAPPGRGGGK
jgi:hypothetical protein